MGGYITKSYTKFVHKDDKCPSNTSNYVCSSYNATTQSIETGKCQGHRNVGTNRTLPFVQYGPGSVIHHTHLNQLRESIITELNARRNHIWYSGKLSNPVGSNIRTGILIEHSQENVINKCIAELNAKINELNDYKIIKDENVKSHRVVRGDVIMAENLKYLERNAQASYQDCICYSDCTMHGLSSWTERVWCGSYGDGGGY